MIAQESGDDLSVLVNPITKRELVTDFFLLVLIGLIIQGFWSWRVQEPTYMDAYYYTTNGYRLSQGKGFSESIIWQFSDNPQGLPTPSHSYWMPLPSLIAAAGYMIWDDFRGAQLLFWLFGGLLPLLSYGIVKIVAGERWQAWAAALFTAAGSFYSAFLGQPTTFVPFAWAGASALLFIGLATARFGRRNTGLFEINLRERGIVVVYLFATGVTAGAAHLTRADGLLLLVTAVVIWTAFGLRSVKTDENSDGRLMSESNKDHPIRTSVRSILGGVIIIAAGYLLVMGPWLIRIWTEFGRLLPRGGTRSLFLTSYDDIFAYNRLIDARSYFEWGFDNIVRSKLQGLSIGFQTYVAVVCFIFLVPFIVIGGLKSLRHPDRRNYVRPVIFFGVTLYLVMTLVYTFPGIRGSLFHSSIALWPWATAMAALGIGYTIDWAARRLTHWQPEKAKRRFTAMFVAISLLVGFSISWPRTISEENGQLFSEIGSSLPDGSVVLVGDAPAFYYYTGLPAITVPNEPIEGVLAAAMEFGGSFLLLDENHPLPLVDLYHGTKSYPGVKLLKRYDSMKLYQLAGSNLGSN